LHRSEIPCQKRSIAKFWKPWAELRTMRINRRITQAESPFKQGFQSFCSAFESKKCWTYSKSFGRSRNEAFQYCLLISYWIWRREKAASKTYCTLSLLKMKQKS
jgi:hypothetical protein